MNIMLYCYCEVIEMTKTVYNHILRIKSSLDNQARGMTSSLDMFHIINYIDWCKRFKKASPEVLDELVKYVLAVQDMDDDGINHYVNMDFAALMDSAKPKVKYQVFCRSSEPYSRWVSYSRKYDTKREANDCMRRACKSGGGLDILYKVKEC